MFLRPLLLSIFSASFLLQQPLPGAEEEKPQPGALSPEAERVQKEMIHALTRLLGKQEDEIAVFRAKLPPHSSLHFDKNGKTGHVADLEGCTDLLVVSCTGKGMDAEPRDSEGPVGMYFCILASNPATGRESDLSVNYGIPVNSVRATFGDDTGKDIFSWHREDFGPSDAALGNLHLYVTSDPEKKPEGEKDAGQGK